jgi:tRNA (guanine-N7-)-methyltransferase
MGKDKLLRYTEVNSFDNVLEPTMEHTKGEIFPLKGKWNKEYFKRDAPIVLELGCGKGEYTVGLAQQKPENNYIGMDIKGARIWRGALDANELKLKNVGFLRQKVDFLEHFFGPQEVDEIWLTFSDPQPKKPNKRLSSRPFIDRYLKILKPGGIVHMKTDSTLLYESTLEQIELFGYKAEIATADVYNDFVPIASEKEQEILKIRTHYEKLFTSKGSVIKYIRMTIH